MSAGEPFRRFAADVRPEIEAELERLLPPASAPPERLHEAMRYSVFAGGKRLRPALVLLAGELFGAPRRRLVPGAVAVEAIHTYSLVHDDLPALDDDDLRRGRPTVHRAYDEATAILVGDALLTFGLTTLARLPAEAPGAERARAATLVGEAIGTAGMIGGQMADLEAERHWPE
ncbi:MAG TPA: polyprenyl synthetase family protein, partial [Thermoanaerobaculia bacterium]|nr:polyprenyl synthetase family protein [Thermoanaerobaculia bacterium]